MVFTTSCLLAVGPMHAEMLNYYIVLTQMCFKSSLFFPFHMIVSENDCIDISFSTNIVLEFSVNVISKNITGFRQNKKYGISVDYIH